MALIPASFVTALVRERLNNKHLQIVSGVSKISYWFANFIVELLKYYITGGIIVLLILAFDKYEDYLWLLYIVYGIPTILFAYCISLFFNSESSAQNIIIGMYFIIGALAGSIIFFLRLFDDIKSIAKVISFVFRVVPLFSFCNGFSIILNKSSVYFSDNPNAKVYKELDVLSIDYIGLDLLYMIGMAIIFIIILIIFEVSNSKLSFLKFQENQPNLNGIEDEEVKKEIEKANLNEEKINLEEKDVYSIKIKNLEKTYSSCFSNSNHAIRNVSFCLEYGDCFALLGVNGAGKSSLFKCLTNEILPEKGNIYINGRSISSDFENIRNQLGYCPQIDAIFEELTVKENLEFYAAIKGVTSDKTIKENIISSLISELKLSEFTHKLSGQLSGGNKRKLSVAIAMIGNPPIILLDEPSAGMDPEARRYMWSVIHSITKEKKLSTVILTTHSMEEAETLCQKMGILVRGRFKCYGSSHVIKENYGTGFEVFITVKSLSNMEISNILTSIGYGEEDKVSYEMLGELLKKLNSNLSHELISKGNIGYNLHDDIEKYRSVFVRNVIQWSYRITSLFTLIKGLLSQFEKVTISEYWGNAFQLKIEKKENVTVGYLFGYLDSKKDECNVNEYSISQTSLEQIFNMFANQDEFNNQAVSDGHKPPIDVNNQYMTKYFNRNS